MAKCRYFTLCDFNGLLVFGITVSIFCANILRIKTERKHFFTRNEPGLFPGESVSWGHHHIVGHLPSNNSFIQVKVVWKS